MIAPAQVPNVGLVCTKSFSFWKHSSPSSFRKVVDSPPGITRPSISSNCSSLRTSTTSAPSSSRRRWCAAKSPCSARTPIFISQHSAFSRQLSATSFRQTEVLPVKMPDNGKGRGIAAPTDNWQLITASPPSGLQQIFFGDGADCQPFHGAGHLLADFGQYLGIVVVRGGDHDGTCARLGFFAFFGVAEIQRPWSWASAGNGRVGSLAQLLHDLGFHCFA